jgi:ribosomal protein S7
MKSLWLKVSFRMAAAKEEGAVKKRMDTHKMGS